VEEVARQARRLRRRLRAAKLRGTIWKPLAIVEAALLLALVGVGAGLFLHIQLAQLTPTGRPAPLAETGGVGPAGSPKPTEAQPPRSTPAAASTPSPAESAVVQAAVAEAAARTGIAYAASGCAPVARCFSRAVETDGTGAAYVQLAVQGYDGGSRCYVYLDQPSGAWQVVAMACGASDVFAPALKSVVTVHATGSCGRVRKAAGLSGAVVRCLSNGSRLNVTGVPEYADGEVWWPVADTSMSGVIAQEVVIDPAALVAATG
jgi:hypothetical protein